MENSHGRGADLRAALVVMKLLTVLAASAGIAALATPALAEEVELKAKFEPGKTQVYEQKMNMTSNMMGQAMNMTMTMGLLNSAKAHDEGTAVTMDFDSLAMKMEMGGQVVMDIDTKNEETLQGPAGAQFKSITDVSATGIFKDGKFVKVIDTKGLDGAAAQMFDQATLEQSIKGSTDFLPTTPVKVGDTWQATSVMPMKDLGGELTTAIDAKLDEIKEVDGKKMAIISFTGKVSSPEGAPMTVEAKKFVGTIDFDVADGVTKKMTNDIDMAITAPGAPEKIEMQMKTAMELIEIKDSE